MKTRDEVLNQDYVTAKDIQIIIGNVNIITCRELIDEVREEMKNKRLYVPPGTKPKRALTKLVKKKLGI